MWVNTNLIDRTKLLFRKDKELHSALHRIMGFYPHNAELYKTAFAHRSSEIKGKNGKPLNNERLEYLGDAVLEMIVSDILFKRYPRKREGFLTSTRSKIVQRSTLNQLADKMGVVQFVKVSMRPTEHNNIGGNAFEALMGAIYLDRGYRYCYRFVEREMLGKYLDLEKLARREENFKSKLLEWGQKNKLHLDFRLQKMEAQGGGAANIFYYDVYVEGIKAGEGKGFSNKESHQRAARAALAKLKKDPAFLQKVYAAKEERTQMEAEVYAVVPEV